MKYLKLRYSLSALLILVLNTSSFCQSGNDKPDPEYIELLNARAEKIVSSLNLNDQEKSARVQEIIVQQYYQLSLIHDSRDADTKAINENNKNTEEIKIKLIDATNDKASTQIYELHASFIGKLSAELTFLQIDKVKDGFTYGVLSRTYNAYLKMLPDLSDEQKRFIQANLIEARELAMDKGSSKNKHATFGKYKGRINNYLSQAGYDLKKAEKDMNERLKKE